MWSGAGAQEPVCLPAGAGACCRTNRRSPPHARAGSVDLYTLRGQNNHAGGKATGLMVRATTRGTDLLELCQAPATAAARAAAHVPRRCSLFTAHCTFARLHALFCPFSCPFVAFTDHPFFATCASVCSFFASSNCRTRSLRAFEFVRIRKNLVVREGE